MSYSTLKRRTPLKAKSGFKPFCGLKGTQTDKVYDKHQRKPTEATKKGEGKKKKGKASLVCKLDMVFSLFIRLRDAMDGGMTVCISCGRTFPFEQMQCGHYHGRRSLSTRWDEDNCNAECAVDNCSNQNHLVGYTKNLIAKIGQERFNRLAAKANTIRKWSENELREMIDHYTSECRRISKEKGIRIRL